VVESFGFQPYRPKAISPIHKLAEAYRLLDAVSDRASGVADGALATAVPNTSSSGAHGRTCSRAVCWSTSCRATSCAAASWPTTWPPHFQSVQVYRFPDGEYERFRQIVLFGVHRQRPIAPEMAEVERLRAIGRGQGCWTLSSCRLCPLRAVVGVWRWAAGEGGECHRGADFRAFCGRKAGRRGRRCWIITGRRRREAVDGRYGRWRWGEAGRGASMMADRLRQTLPINLNEWHHIAKTNAEFRHFVGEFDPAQEKLNGFWAAVRRVCLPMPPAIDVNGTVIVNW
jgi:hypothetical protein